MQYGEQSNPNLNCKQDNYIYRVYGDVSMGVRARVAVAIRGWY